MVCTRHQLWTRNIRHASSWHIPGKRSGTFYRPAHKPQSRSQWGTGKVFYRCSVLQCNVPTEGKIPGRMMHECTWRNIRQRPDWTEGPVESDRHFQTFVQEPKCDQPRVVVFGLICIHGVSSITFTEGSYCSLLDPNPKVGVKLFPRTTTVWVPSE